MSNDSAQDPHKGIQVGDRIRLTHDWSTWGNSYRAGTEATVYDLLAQGCFAVQFTMSKGMIPAVLAEKVE